MTELLPMYLNGLQESNKMKRCAAYKKMAQQVINGQLLLSSEEAFSVIRACLRGFEDSSERCREEAVRITTFLLDSQEASILDWVLPSVVTRIGVQPVAEESEEIRLLLLRLSVQCMTCFPREIGPRNYIDFFQVLLENCFRDPFPDLKKEACRATVQLCNIEPKQVRAIAPALAKSLKDFCMLHKHAAVRSEAVETFAFLCSHGASAVFAEGKDEPDQKTTAYQLFVLANDHSESVRRKVLSALSCALLDIKERLEQHTRYMPHLLLLATDAFESVSSEAMRILEKVGELYRSDNEDNRIDLSSRRITLKDLEWYADDEYPEINLDETQRFKILQNRPPLGSRYAVADASRQFIPKLLSDITAIDWVIPFSNNNRRVVALRVLWVTLLHCEKYSVQYAEKVLSAMYKALRDENSEVNTEAVLCVRILGYFLTPDQYLPFFIAKTNSGDEVTEIGAATIHESSSADENEEKTPTLFSTAAITTKCAILIAFGYLLQGSVTSLSDTHAALIVRALTSPDLLECENEEVLLALLETLQSVFSVFSARGFIASPAKPLPESVVTDLNQRTLDSMLLYALLKIKSSEFPRARARADECITTLSMLVTGSPTGIFLLHGERIISRYGSVLPVTAFGTLVSQIHTSNLSSILRNVFVDKLTDIDFSVKVTAELQYFRILEQLLWNHSELFSVDDMIDIIKLVVIPHGNFRPGTAMHLFRKVAINCLCALSDDFYRVALLPALTADNKALSTNVLTLWCSASDSDDGEMRLVCVTALPNICTFPMTAGAANEVVQSITLRFDDSNDTLRFLTASGLHKTIVNESAPEYRAELNSQIVPLTKKMLVYMDDDEDQLGLAQEIVTVIKLLSDVSPNIILDLVRSSRDKHTFTNYCDDIINYIEERHS